MTDYRTLPDDVKREIVYATIAVSKAAYGLAALTDQLPEVWADRIASQAYSEVDSMTEAQIEDMIGQIEQARKGSSYGVQRIEIKPDKPKGFGK